MLSLAMRKLRQIQSKAFNKTVKTAAQNLLLSRLVCHIGILKTYFHQNDCVVDYKGIAYIFFETLERILIGR